MPMFVFCPMPIVVLAIVVQLTPSGDVHAVNVFPLRASFTHEGATTVDVPPRNEEGCPPLVREIIADPLGVIAASTERAPVVIDSRIITPAFASAFVFCSDAMRAMIWPLPTSGWYT